MQVNLSFSVLENNESRTIYLENLDFLEEELHPRYIGDSVGWLEFGPIKPEDPTDFESILLHSLQLSKTEIVWFYLIFQGRIFKYTKPIKISFIFL